MLTRYVPPGHLNVKAFGATGNGSGDDQPAIQAAIDAANAAGGGTVILPAGTYQIAATLTLYSNVILRGAGPNATKIKLANSSNVDMVKTTGFATYTGNDVNSGPANFGLTDLTLDGNKANQSSGRGIVIYGKSYHLDRIIVQNTKGDGIYSEWYTGGDQMEASISHFKVIDSGGNGIYWKGPHDSVIADGQVIRSGTSSAGIVLPSGAAAGTIFVGVHVWGSQSIAWEVRSSAHMIGCVGEGSSSIQCLLDSQDAILEGCDFFGVGTGDTSVGLKIGDTGTGAYPSRCRVSGRVKAVGTAVQFAREGGSNRFDLVVAPKSGGTVVSGTQADTDVLTLTDDSGTRKSVSAVRDRLQLLSRESDAVKFIDDANGNVDLLWSASAHALQLRQGSTLALFSDNGSTRKLYLNGSSGDLELSGTAKIQGGAYLRSGSGSPEGVVVAPIGDVYLRTDGAGGSIVYVKESGAGLNTGWVAYGPSSAGKPHGFITPAVRLSQTTVAMAANKGWFCRFFCPGPFTVTDIAYVVTTPAGSNDNVDVGIYDSALSKVASSGSTAGKLNGSGLQTISLSATLARGVYYAAISQGALGSSAASLAASNLGSNAAIAQLLGTAEPKLTQGSKASVFALPASTSSLAAETSVPLLAVRGS